jgi:hypothetical protein
MTNHELLEKFGQILMNEVRDEAIDKYEMIVSGQMRSASALEFSKKLSALDDEYQSLVRDIVVSSIDDVLHNLLWMIERHEDDVELTYSDGKCKININEVSDGLSGEVYTADGWISLFSKYKKNY